MTKDVVVIDGVRTPQGVFGGALKQIPAQDLGVIAAKELLKRTKIKPAEVDEVVIGCVGQGSDAPNIARVIALRAGIPIQTPAFTVQRNCASGLQAIVSGDGPLTLLLCEDITNIDNIGLLFRNAAAFGVDGVLLSPKCHDPLYRKSLRVAIGHALTVPFARSEDWSGELAKLQQECNVTLVAAALDERAVELDSAPCPKRVGLVVGPEFDGLPSATLDQCDAIVKVPMAPGVDSLNVAVAAAVCLNRFSTGKRI